jgi:hypothetical protein
VIGAFFCYISDVKLPNELETLLHREQKVSFLTVIVALNEDLKTLS